MTDPRADPVGRPQRLLFVHTGTRGDGTEGADRHVVTLARAMATAGHVVAAVVTADGPVHHALADETRIELFPTRAREAGGAGGARAVMRATLSARPTYVLGTVDAARWLPALAARALNVPVALIWHGDASPQPPTPLLLLRLASLVLVCSEFHRERLVARGLSRARVEVLYPPVDTTRLRVDPVARREMRTSLGFAPDDVVVGFVGSLERECGVEPLAEALRQAMFRAPAIQALWVGRGSRAVALRETFARHGDGRRHTWNPGTDDVPTLYRAMDLIALPAVDDAASPRVLVEAQACGLPVLASRVGGLAEVVEDGATGLLLPAGDVVGWRHALLRLAADEPERRRMGANGRAFASRVYDARLSAGELARVLADASRSA